MQLFIENSPNIFDSDAPTFINIIDIVAPIFFDRIGLIVSEERRNKHFDKSHGIRDDIDHA